MTDLETTSKTATPIAVLLDDPEWPEALVEEILGGGAACWGAALVDFIRERRRARIEDRALLRACRLAGVLRVPDALPLLLDLALDPDASDRALRVALRVARSYGEPAREAARALLDDRGTGRAAPGLRSVEAEQRTRHARRLHRELLLLCALRPLAELDDDDEVRFGGPPLYPQERGQGRNAPDPYLRRALRPLEDRRAQRRVKR